MNILNWRICWILLEIKGTTHYESPQIKRSWAHLIYSAILGLLSWTTSQNCMSSWFLYLPSWQWFIYHQIWARSMRCSIFAACFKLPRFPRLASSVGDECLRERSQYADSQNSRTFPKVPVSPISSDLCCDDLHSIYASVVDVSGSHSVSSWLAVLRNPALGQILVHHQDHLLLARPNFLFWLLVDVKTLVEAD